ncbi:MAG: amino acid permease, partial [Mycobacteriaceae bacterium]
LMVTTPLLLRRLRGWPAGDSATPAQEKLFSLGRWGIVVNLLAVLWGFVMVINLGWPRSAVFDPAGGNWYLKWFAELFLAGALVVGALAYLHQRHENRREAAALEPVPALGLAGQLA